MHMAIFPLSLLSVGAIVAGAVRVKRLLPAGSAVIFVGSWSLPHAVVELSLMGLLIWPIVLSLAGYRALAGGSRFSEPP